MNFCGVIYNKEPDLLQKKKKPLKQFSETSDIYSLHYFILNKVNSFFFCKGN
jgi:hypothetical protein